VNGVAEREITVTYETLFELLRLEKSRAELQTLSPAFFADLANYVREKQEILNRAEQKTDLFALTERDKTRAQLENIRRIIKELWEKRESKILSLAINKSRTGSSIIDTSALLAEEKEFFEQLVALLNQFRGTGLMPLLYGKPVANQRDTSDNPPAKDAKLEEPEPKKETVLVRFVKSVPQFVGKELEVYGPFEEEDMANLPSEIADVLIKKGRAVAME
jgi:DNA replication initiation complex subunit (GINS family)